MDNSLNGFDGSKGTGGTIWVRYKRMLWDDRHNNLGNHGIGGELMFHLNGYGTEGDSNPFIYRSLAARYYYLFQNSSSLKCYLSGKILFKYSFLFQ